MVRVIVFGEGATEEKFIKEVLAPSLWERNVFLSATQMRTSTTGRGGALSIDRVLKNVRNTLLQQSDAVIATFFDLYALDSEFPGFVEAAQLRDVYDRVRLLEQALHQVVVTQTRCQGARFIPHIQPHEFEGLLFSDVGALVGVDPGWRAAESALQAIRDAHDTPEHINDGFATAPSKRLAQLLKPHYKKTSHGPLAAQRIGMDVIERECPHFQQWVNTLRNLGST